MTKKSKMKDRAATTATIRDGDLIFHHGLVTWVERIAYEWRDRYGQVWCSGPVDMSGAIALFTAIDGNVALICAYMNDRPDVVYRKRNGQWEVGDLRRLDDQVLTTWAQAPEYYG
jgi:hypothetical protein